MKISNGQFSANIKPFGAELYSLKNKKGKEFIWQADPKFWAKSSPILFPIVGTLKNNKYTCNNAEYSLPRHGFARDNEFKILQKEEDSISFFLEADEDSLKKYPFNFYLQIGYELEKNGLTISYRVFNKGISPMPFSIGAHPAFAISNLDNYNLEFNKNTTLECFPLEDGLIGETPEVVELDENKLHLNYNLFEKDALVIKNIASKSVLISEKSKPILKVTYTDFPDLGIWTMKDAGFLCIEPWCGYADTVAATGDIFSKEGIIVLPPDEVFVAEFKIEILEK